MIKKDYNAQIKKNGFYSASNDVAGWYAISRDGINMIVYYEGKWTFTKKDDMYKFYTKNGFIKKVGDLVNGKW
jgi:hypothetical protein